MHTAPAEVLMSPMMIFASIVLGCDALLYVFFQWIYSEKSSRNHHRRSATRRHQYRSHATTEVKAPAAPAFPHHSLRQRTGFY
jgi:hypothetical protein